MKTKKHGILKRQSLRVFFDIWVENNFLNNEKTLFYYYWLRNGCLERMINLISNSKAFFLKLQLPRQTKVQS